jgi:hypothetical protein
MHELRVDELDRFRSRLGDLSPEQLAVVEEYGRGLVNKILHRPTVELKRSVDGRAAPGQVDLVRRLFGLDEETAAARARAAAPQEAPSEKAGSHPGRVSEGGA